MTLDQIVVPLPDRQLPSRRLDRPPQVVQRGGKVVHLRVERRRPLGIVAIDIGRGRPAEAHADLLDQVGRIALEHVRRAVQERLKGQPGRNVVAGIAALLQGGGVQGGHQAQRVPGVVKGVVCLPRLPRQVPSLRRQGVDLGANGVKVLPRDTARTAGEARPLDLRQLPGQLRRRSLQDRQDRPGPAGRHVLLVGQLDQLHDRLAGHVNRLPQAVAQSDLGHLPHPRAEVLPGARQAGKPVVKAAASAKVSRGVVGEQAEHADRVEETLGLLLDGRELRRLHPLVGQTLFLGQHQHLFAKPLGLHHLPGRDVLEVALPGRDRQSQDVAAETFMAGQQEGDGLPPLRLDHPAQEQLRGGELPRLAVGEESFRRGQVLRLLPLPIGRADQGQGRVLGAADGLHRRHRERIQRHDPAVVEDRDVLPGSPVQRRGGGWRGCHWLRQCIDGAPGSQEDESPYRDLCTHACSRDGDGPEEIGPHVKHGSDAGNDQQAAKILQTPARIVVHREHRLPKLVAIGRAGQLVERPVAGLERALKRFLVHAVRQPRHGVREALRLVERDQDLLCRRRAVFGHRRRLAVALRSTSATFSGGKRLTRLE